MNPTNFLNTLYWVYEEWTKEKNDKLASNRDV